MRRALVVVMAVVAMGCGKAAIGPEPIDAVEALYLLAGDATPVRDFACRDGGSAHIESFAARASTGAGEAKGFSLRFDGCADVFDALPVVLDGRLRIDQEGLRQSVTGEVAFGGEYADTLVVELAQTRASVEGEQVPRLAVRGQLQTVRGRHQVEGVLTVASDWASLPRSAQPLPEGTNR